MKSKFIIVFLIFVFINISFSIEEKDYYLNYLVLLVENNGDTNFTSIQQSFELNISDPDIFYNLHPQLKNLYIVDENGNKYYYSVDYPEEPYYYFDYRLYFNTSPVNSETFYNTTYKSFYYFKWREEYPDYFYSGQHQYPIWVALRFEIEVLLHPFNKLYLTAPNPINGICIDVNGKFYACYCSPSGFADIDITQHLKSGRNYIHILKDTSCSYYSTNFFFKFKKRSDESIIFNGTKFIKNPKITINITNLNAGEKRKLYVYFGGDRISSSYNPYLTYSLFDDFDNNTIDTNKWQISTYSWNNDRIFDYRVENGYLKLYVYAWGENTAIIYFVSKKKFINISDTNSIEFVAVGKIANCSYTEAKCNSYLHFSNETQKPPWFHWIYYYDYSPWQRYDIYTRGDVFIVDTNYSAYSIFSHRYFIINRTTQKVIGKDVTRNLYIQSNGFQNGGFYSSIYNAYVNVIVSATADATLETIRNGQEIDFIYVKETNENVNVIILSKGSKINIFSTTIQSEYYPYLYRLNLNVAGAYETFPLTVKVFNSKFYSNNISEDNITVYTNQNYQNSTAIPLEINLLQGKNLVEVSTNYTRKISEITLLPYKVSVAFSINDEKTLERDIQKSLIFYGRFIGKGSFRFSFGNATKCTTNFIGQMNEALPIIFDKTIYLNVKLKCFSSYCGFLSFIVYKNKTSSFYTSTEVSYSEVPYNGRIMYNFDYESNKDVWGIIVSVGYGNGYFSIDYCDYFNPDGGFGLNLHNINFSNNKYSFIIVNENNEYNYTNSFLSVGWGRGDVETKSSLYLLPQENAQLITFTLQDETNCKNDRYMVIERLYTNLKFVKNSILDVNCKFRAYLEPYQFYKVKIFDINGNLIFQSDVFQIIQSEYFIKIPKTKQSTESKFFNYYGYDLTYSCKLIENSTIMCSITDLNNKVFKVKFGVYKPIFYSNATICYSEEKTSSATFICNISNYDEVNTRLSFLPLEENVEVEIPLFSSFFNVVNKFAQSQFGIIPLLFFTAMIVIFAFNPIALLIATPILLFIMFVLKILTFSTTSIMYVVALVVFIFIVIKRNYEV